jgi:hypothetical protein
MVGKPPGNQQGWVGWLPYTTGFLLGLFSLLIPVVGVIVAVIFLSRDGASNRETGENCLNLALTGLCAGALLWLCCYLILR